MALALDVRKGDPNIDDLRKEMAFKSALVLSTFVIENLTVIRIVGLYVFKKIVRTKISKKCGLTLS